MKARGEKKNTSFAIDGAEHKFHWADARIEGNNSFDDRAYIRLTV